MRSREHQRRFLSLAAALFLALTPRFSADVYAEESFMDLRGAEVVRIGSEEDWKSFAAASHVDAWSKGRRVVLDADLTFSGDETPRVAYFAGCFDGQGHTLNSVTIRTEASGAGLFDQIAPEGIVQDLRVNGVALTSGRQEKVGGIAGINHGRIENCEYFGSVEAHTEAGGIAGINMDTGVVADCRASGVVEGDSSVGGIVGYNEGSVEDCENKTRVNTVYIDVPFSTDDLTLTLDAILQSGRVTTVDNAGSKMDVGGIAGLNAGEVRRSVNSGPVGYEHVGYNIGGIAGRSTGLVKDCVNTGEVTGRRDVGGIVGQQQPDIEIVFSETGLGRIGAQLDKLQRMIDEALDDTENYTADTGARLRELSKLVSTAKGDVSTLTDDAGARLDEASSRANVALEQGQLSLRDLAEAGGRIADYADTVNAAAEAFEQEVSAFADGIEMTDEDRSIYESALERFHAALDMIRDAVARLRAVPGQEDVRDPREVIDALASIRSAYQDLKNGVRSLQGAAADLTAVLARYADQAAEASLSHWDPLRERGEKLERAMNDLPELDPLIPDALRRIADIDARTDGVSESARAANSDLYATVDSMIARSDELNSMLGNAATDAAEDLKKINAQIGVLGDLIGAEVNEQLGHSADPGELTEDISDEDIENTVRGRTTGSRNTGKITADADVGGVAGYMGVDLEIDPERDVSALTDQKGRATMTERAVVDDCENAGEVECRNSYAGGIVGRMLIGIACSNRSTGRVQAGGSYAGGIAGYSGASLRNNLVRTEVQAVDHAGGVAGSGSVLKDNRVIVTITDATQCIGAIAGEAEEITAEKLAGNLYCGSNVHAVGDVDYVGLAEHAEHKIVAEGAEEFFQLLRITFCAENETVAVRNCEFGGSIDESEIPAVPDKEGFTGIWSRTDFHEVTAEERVEAIYTRIVTLIPCEEKRADGQPVFLTEGSFRQSDRIIVTDHEATETEDGAFLREEWFTLELPPDRGGNDGQNRRLRFLPAPEMGDVVVSRLNSEGKWERLTVGTMGQYLTFEIPGDHVMIMAERSERFTERLRSYALPIGLSTGVGAVMIISLLIYLKRRPVKPKA